MNNYFVVRITQSAQSRPSEYPGIDQFRPPIAVRTDLLHITTELWEIPVLRMAH